MNLQSKQSGFTLMELLIAIMISGMVFMGVFTVVRAGINTQMYVREMSDAGRQGPAILSQLKDDLENAYFYNIIENNFFDGKQIDIGNGNRGDQIHFITCRPSLLDDDEISVVEPHKAMLTEVSWVLKENPNDDRYFELHRREQPMVNDRQFSGGYFRMISNRVISFRVQYTGWKFGGEDLETRLGQDLAGNSSRGNEGSKEDGEGPAEESLEWDDEWSSRDNGALPVAVKIELVVSPDIDQDVMDRMSRDGREQELDRSYIHIILLPQYREDKGNMQATSIWDGTIAEPFQQGGGAGGGARGPNGQTGARGGRNNGGRNGNNGNNPTGTRQTNSTTNPFLNIIRGGNNGAGGANSGANPLGVLRGGNR